MRKLILLTILIFTIVVSGCTQDQSPSTAEQARLKCIQICQEKINEKIDLSSGPCLSDDNPEWNVDDWVCDVAHLPRQSVDNIAKNQCQEFRQGNAHHFVEVDPNCSLIKSI